MYFAFLVTAEGFFKILKAFVSFAEIAVAPPFTVFVAGGFRNCQVLVVVIEGFVKVSELLFYVT